METFRIVIVKNTQRKDGKYSVSIRVTHQQKITHIATGYYAGKHDYS